MDADTKSKIEKHIRKHRKDGGKAGSPEKGTDDAEKDLKMKPADRTADNKVGPEAEEMKAKKGGRIKRKHGGMTEKKEVGKMEGHEAMHHAGRKRRASGGGCEANPFTSAMKGTNASGRKTENESKGSDH